MKISPVHQNWGILYWYVKVWLTKSMVCSSIQVQNEIELLLVGGPGTKNITSQHKKILAFGCIKQLLVWNRGMAIVECIKCVRKYYTLMFVNCDQRELLDNAQNQATADLKWSWLAAYCALEFLITITIAHMILIMHFVHHQRSRFFTWLHNSCPQQLLVLNKVPHETCSYKILFKKTFHNWELQLDRKNTSKKILIYAYLVWTLHTLKTLSFPSPCGCPLLPSPHPPWCTALWL